MPEIVKGKEVSYNRATSLTKCSEVIVAIDSVSSYFSLNMLDIYLAHGQKSMPKPLSTMSSEHGGSKIPVAKTMKRSNSMRLRGETLRSRTLCYPIAETDTRRRTMSVTDGITTTPVRTPVIDEEDTESLQSFASGCSTMSCDHAYFGRNGTTFSGRSMRYVVHCSSHSGDGEEYLTPTQRASRQIRRLKALLNQTRKDLEMKDHDILRLTKEVVELRLFKASLTGGNEDQVDSGENEEEGREGSEIGVEDKHEEKGTPESEKTDPPASLADSGHFEDLTLSSVYSKGTHHHTSGKEGEDREGERKRIVDMYEKRLEELQHRHVDEVQELKERHNDKVESLLQRLTDTNHRYCELRSDYDKAQDLIRKMEKEMEILRKNAEEHEERHKSMYLKMYLKGQEAAKFEHADEVLEFARKAPNRVSVPELLQQLQATENELENIKDMDERQLRNSKFPLLSAKEAISLWLLGTRKALYRRLVESHASKGQLDPEMTLQFLKSAVYYFLTDKENHQGHLNAIKSILGFTEMEKVNIDKACKA